MQRPSASPADLEQPRRTAAAVLCLLGLLLGSSMLPTSIRAAEIEGVSFPDRVQAADLELPLFGLGLLRYRVLFRGYVGGLYLSEGVSGSRVLEDVPKALELRYFWAIEGRFFGEAADELLARALPPERLAALRGRVDRLHALYQDVEVGDRYRLTYVPERGMTLAKNGRELGTIEGADFASAYFGIWLGDDPLSVAFRDQILADRTASP